MKVFLGLLIAVSVAGCMSGGSDLAVSPAPPEAVERLAGTWQGWLVTERSFALFHLDIKRDGTFEVTGPWTRANGILVIDGDRMRFDGTGVWRGTLTLKDRGDQRQLRLERDDRLVRGTLHRLERQE